MQDRGCKYNYDLILALKRGYDLAWIWTHIQITLAKTETSHFNDQPYPASKSSFLNVKFIAGDSLTLEKEMVLMWILSFLIQSFVYLINGSFFPQKFVADQNIIVVK